SLFRTVELDEPSDDDAQAIVNLASDSLAQHHGVTYNFDVYAYAVQMSRTARTPIIFLITFIFL
ncbi:MAG TPA: hypothetical protein O0X74_04440, partial [Methanocorpusculum sp.]|nr:hypothetical protein [Methanocorpusculum sp.]